MKKRLVIVIFSIFIALALGITFRAQIHENITKSPSSSLTLPQQMPVLSSEEIRITTNEVVPSPKIKNYLSGEAIIWQDHRDPVKAFIYTRDSANTERLVKISSSAKYNPSISGNKLLWSEFRNKQWDLFMYDLLTEQETQITNNDLPESEFTMDGNKIVWKERENMLCPEF